MSDNTNLKIKITSFNIYKGAGKNAPTATISVVINNVLKINGLKIIESQKGSFVSWPARKIGDRWVPYISFADEAKDLKEKISNYLVGQYEKGNITEKKQYTGNSNKASYNKPTENRKGETEKQSQEDEDDDLPF